MNHRSVRIERFDVAQADALADLYHEAIHSIADNLYDTAQREAWAPTPPDYAWWRDRLKRMNPWVAVIDGEVVGFIELRCQSNVVDSLSALPENSLRGHIDCLYTHSAYQGRGIASALYGRLQEEAESLGCCLLTVDASLVAEAFFRARGFVVIKRNLIKLRGQHLANCSMHLDLDG